tara:strand:- start:570 stop:1010 length:441 start_codon:yes stop_codon:yes gene_type:complete
MPSESLLDLKRGINMEKKVKVIKDTPRVEEQVRSDDVISLMEKEWPEMTKEFKKLQREQYELFLHKQHDYGPGNISVGTQLKTKEEINLSLTGLWFRMNDKLQRVKTLLMTGRKSAVKDEPLEDAYLDVSNYGIMATIVARGKWGK